MSGRGHHISIGDSVAYLAVLVLSICLVVYLIIDPIAYKANYSYTSAVKNVRKEAHQKGQYVVYETDKQNPHSVFGFIFLFGLFSFMIIVVFLGFLSTGPLDGLMMPLAVFMIAMWAIFTSIYILYMLMWPNKLIIVTNAGIGLKLLYTKGRTTNEFIGWPNIAQVKIGVTEQGGDRFGIYLMDINGRTHVKMYGDWINAKLFCRDALKHIQSSCFTQEAMNYFSKYAAKETDLPVPPAD